MALFSIVSDLESGDVKFGIVADETDVRYVGAPSGLDDERIARSLRRASQPTDTPEGKLLAAGRNLGYVQVSDPKPATSIAEAERLVREALA